ncbi:MAG TPA: sialate O-acetylesterase [Polyangia bacterium]|nr:sialate O-acetylesterase [Polyangia bacterium]
MMLQRGRPVRLWGTAAPGESIRATLAGGKAATQANGGGQWALTLPAVPAGGPFVLSIEGSNALTFSDVWSGEVWVASGQSNMEFTLARSKGAEQAVAGGCPGLRLFTVAKATAGSPKADVSGAWQVCDADTAKDFSAVAFYFGQELHRALGVPVGLIHSSWGGTPAEAWTSREALRANVSFRPMIDALDGNGRDEGARAEAARKVAAWEAKSFHKDTGNLGEAQGFARAGGSGWLSMKLPQFWEEAGLHIDGAVWFRREVVLPADWAGVDLALSLGAIDDFDVTYWNGERVGATGAETPDYWSIPRLYQVPGRLAKAGRNVIAVRVFDHYGSGGLAGPASQMTVRRDAVEVTTLPLAGSWSYKIERSLQPIDVDFSSRPELMGIDNSHNPTVLWNGMIAPITPFPIAGTIWYQGESNASRAQQYRTLFPTMINAWRTAWRDPALPFVFVQLPNYQEPGAAKPLGTSTWAELREAQSMTLSLPKTAMAVTLDIGEHGDIHPRNKRDVGRRLALQALKVVYGKEVIASGPIFRKMARASSSIRVSFANATSALISSDGAAPKGFMLAGADRTWHWAEARIDGDSVIVSSHDVPEPVAVRYGWADDPPNTLRNLADLPAAPFRTDDWPALSTQPGP